ncbi:transcriptional regulator [Pseudorhodoferax aquiterrae]|uniref:Transcriptional regulator n=1 Tax=Pseudorhodoferax aquiterrae TaxID=747304 RepID=A0ABQ3G965_9BURK|nr:FadR/GntR family transcriptional regulator [Pseudorhodoferax aquiterrae]GHC95853.1 transcriptional regulator [Pseudorhodoferax aquiterrae]
MTNSPEQHADLPLGLEPVRHERFAERVYDSLFHAVMTGRLAPGARLPSEVELAARFQVSRPVVRQALDRLRSDRLVESIRGSGTYVRTQPATMPVVPLARSTADLSHIAHGLELRLVLEPECAFFAAMRRKPRDLARMEEMLEGFENANRRGDVAHHFDYGFHEAIAQASANPRLAQVLKSLEYDVSHAVNLWRHLARMQPWRRTQDALDEHRHIFALIRAQDAEGARRAMRAHVENARVRMLEIEPGT